MGKTERFPDPKRSKSMASKINPGPNQYNMTAKWLGNLILYIFLLLY